MTYQEIHQEAIRKITKYKACHAEVLEILLKVDENKVYLKTGYPTLWSYLINGLNLSETDAGRFLHVLRASQKVPEFKAAVSQGQISFSSAACIAKSVIKENQEQWIEKAKTSSVRKLQRELVTIDPKALPRTKITPRSAEIYELKGGVKTETLELFKRVQDILSQNIRHSASFDETIAELSKHFLKKKDPTAKTGRAVRKPPTAVSQITPRCVPTQAPPTSEVKGRIPIPASLRNHIYRQFKGQCAAKMPDGSRCLSRRFLQIHHKIPVAAGGTNALNNLMLLCSGHHREEHL